MAIVYQTKQRDTVLACLAAHPHKALCAKDIYLYCRAQGTPVGMATIYRKLDSLMAENKAKKIVTDDGKSVCYQYISTQTKADTFYLKCNVCGKVIPADCHELEKVTRHIYAEHGFEIDAARSLLYGHCKECKK